MTALSNPIPAKDIPADKAPGHWILARLGKRVLRPGGLELTRKMIEALNIQHTDHVVEFAPGLGITAKMTLRKRPASYTAIERDTDAAALVRQYLNGDNQHCYTASAHHTELPNQCATVVYGEAMLSMQPDGRKLDIIREAARILPKGGRYAIHELSLENVDAETQRAIHSALSKALHVGATPLTREQWVTLLESAGFTIQCIHSAPMDLLEPIRLLKDEGLVRSACIFYRLIRNAQLRDRVADMRSVFRQYAQQFSAVVIIAEKV